ncbi:helix-hairpin-helix domain-containing protein [Aliiroseovarius sp. CAU 1755]
MAIEHLQLSDAVTHNLRLEGIETISELLIFLLGKRDLSLEQTESSDALVSFLEVCDGPRIDWFRYWELLPRALNHLFIDCAELSSLNEANPICNLDRQYFGNAGPMLSRVGISTLGALVEAMREGIRTLPTGMGEKKKGELLDQMLKLVGSIRAGEPILDDLARRFPVEQNGHEGNGDLSLQTSADWKSSSVVPLTETTRALEIGVLHLGTKATKLREKGYRSVGSLAAASDAELLRLPAFGRSTLRKIRDSIAALGGAQLSNGEIDLEAYCAEMDLYLLPGSPISSDTCSAIAALPAMLTELSSLAFDHEEQLIFDYRVSMPPRERMTLEALGERFPNKVTRERVRQREAKLLRGLAGALIFDDYGKSNFHFRQEVTEPWKAAAIYFSEVADDLSLNDFVVGLENAWGVSRTEFIDQLPLLSAIITGELTTGGEYGETILFDTSPLKRGKGDAWHLPLRSLQLWKAAAQLEDLGLFTIEDLVTALETGAISASTSSATKVGFEQVEALCRLVSDEGHIDWPGYADHFDFELVPSSAAISPLEFLACLNETIAQILEHRGISAHAVRIWQRRCIVDVKQRPSAEALAKELNTYGSGLKRIETTLLVFINDVLVEGHLAIAKCQVRPEVVQFWKQIDVAFTDVGEDIGSLRDRLTEIWELPKGQIDKHLPAIVAVLTGYPYGRLGRHTRLKSSQHVRSRPVAPAISELSPRLPQRISLRGFRRHH